MALQVVLLIDYEKESGGYELQTPPAHNVTCL